ncbi:MAG: hypothetical protein IJW21_09060, partial [Clostridia bacterium]|nr:hypothetical protein [Clostridia bacterium]
MTREMLWEAIGNADEKYLEESEKRTLSARWRVTAAIAACLALMLAMARIFNVDVMLGAASLRNGGGEFADCTEEYRELSENREDDFIVSAAYYLEFSSKQEFYELIAGDEFTEEERRRLAEVLGGR